MPNRNSYFAQLARSFSLTLRTRGLNGPSGMVKPIEKIRDAVCAVLKVRRAANQSAAQPGQTLFEASITGTAWCVVPNRYLVTAYHVLNQGQPRDPADRFYIFAVPRNGLIAHHTAVIGFPVERADVDMAVIEISPPSGFPANIPSLPVTW